jgi:hypothetical protein
VPRERVDLVPELAPRLRIDARGRLIEQEKLRVRQRAGPKRKPLLPAARELAGKLRVAALESEPLDHRARRSRRIGDPVDARDEFQVLAYGEILVEAEALRHVAHVALDLVRLGADVVTEAGAVAFVGGEQPAQHPDGRGLARSIEAEEPVDFPALDPHRQVAHDLVAVEGFCQPFDVDGDIRRRRHWPCPSATLTGWPTRRRSGRSSGRASIRNTSFERSSTL